MKGGGGIGRRLYIYRKSGREREVGLRMDTAERKKGGGLC